MLKNILIYGNLTAYRKGPLSPGCYNAPPPSPEIKVAAIRKTTSVLNEIYHSQTSLELAPKGREKCPYYGSAHITEVEFI